MAYFDDSAPYDIAVIGGGVAGMAAAREAVIQAGVFGAPRPRVGLFEAAPRPGGRAIDGAEWLHPDDNGDNPVYDFVCSAYNLPAGAFHYDDAQNVISITDDGIYYDKEFNRRAYNFIDQYFHERRRQGYPDANISIGLAASDAGDFATGLYAELKTRTWVGVDDPFWVPAGELVGDKYGSGGYQHEDGLEAGVVVPMRKDLQERNVSVLTGRRVVAVIKIEGNVWSLRDDTGRPYTANKVIVAVDPFALKKRAIEFIPALSPHIARYVDGLIGSSLTKVVVPLEYPVSKRPFTRINLLRDGSRVFAHIRNVGNRKAITLFTGGRQAMQMEDLPERKVRQFIKAAFAEISRLKGWDFFGDLQTDEFEVSRWNKKGGVYTACSLGMERMGVVEDKDSGMILCGDYLAKEGASTLVGAWESGREAGCMAAFSHMAPYLPAAIRHDFWSLVQRADIA